MVLPHWQTENSIVYVHPGFLTCGIENANDWSSGSVTGFCAMEIPFSRNVAVILYGTVSVICLKRNTSSAPAVFRFHASILCFDILMGQ
jgi:hypothetical protein